MAFRETTDPDIASQFGETQVAPAQLRKQLEAAWQRIDKAPRRPVYYEPQWEDPGLHGSGREVQLRSSRAARSKIGRGRLAISARRAYSSTALPSVPTRRVTAGQVAVVAGVIVGVSALAWYLWKRGTERSTAVGDDLCGFDALGAD